MALSVGRVTAQSDHRNYPAHRKITLSLWLLDLDFDSSFSGFIETTSLFEALIEDHFVDYRVAFVV